MSIRVVCAMIYDGMVVGGVYGISMTMYELDHGQNLKEFAQCQIERCLLTVQIS